MNTPLVSVVIPTHNRASTISKAVESVLRQTYRNVELIVVDDGSTDATQEILNPFADKIRLVQQSNAGPSSARNNGIRVARGNILAFLDSDDVWLPTKIEQQVTLLNLGGEKMPCCICNATVADTRYGGKTSFDIADLRVRSKVGVWQNATSVLATRFLLFNQVVAVRRDALHIAGGFREDLRLLEDYDLALRLSFLGPWGIIKEPLVITHDDGGNRLSEEADKNPLAVLDAKNDILKVLADQTNDKNFQRFIGTALKDTKNRIRANKLMTSRSSLISHLGWLCLFALNVRDSFWRRTRWWPRVEVSSAGYLIPN